jgi:hypothetical protein
MMNCYVSVVAVVPVLMLLPMKLSPDVSPSSIWGWRGGTGREEGFCEVRDGASVVVEGWVGVWTREL